MGDLLTGMMVLSIVAMAVVGRVAAGNPVAVWASAASWALGVVTGLALGLR